MKKISFILLIGIVFNANGQDVGKTTYRPLRTVQNDAVGGDAVVDRVDQCDERTALADEHDGVLELHPRIELLKRRADRRAKDLPVKE